MDKIAEVLVALIISAAVSMGVSMREQAVQKALLSENLKVTKELSSSVNDLKVQFAIFGERYVTRTELEKKIKE